MTDSADSSGLAHSYDAWSSAYDSDTNPTRDMAGVAVRDRGLTVRDRDVVEIGCGTGLNTVWLAERARSTVALDLSDGMLRVARERVRSPRVEFVRHDICSPWPLDAASADLIVATLVLEHVRDLAPLFAEVARVARPGAELFLCELHPTRQMAGRTAEYTNPRTGELERVAAFIHDVSDYVNGAVGAGFEIVHLGEWRDSGAPQTALPRLLTVHGRRPKGTHGA